MALFVNFEQAWAGMPGLYTNALSKSWKVIQF